MTSKSHDAPLVGGRTIAAPATGTMVAPSTTEAATLVAHDRTLVAGAGPRAKPMQTAARGLTVLPKIEAADGGLQLVHEPRLRYEAERTIGEGGMGIVALAHDRDIDRRVAVKRIRHEIGDQGLARFVEEVRTVGTLEHPNIVPIHDVGVDENGDYFFVMKYVDGDTLESIIEKLASGDPSAHRRFSFDARVQIFLGLLHALAYAHDRGIIHRDIKPANIMIGPYGEVVLMDWGIARRVGGSQQPDGIDLATPDEHPPERVLHTQSGGLIGTPPYMSPEQASASADIDARSDLYSACVVFHELMTLRHYLVDKTTIATILAGVLERELPPVFRADLYGHPSQAPPPAEFVHFMVRGMKKDPAERWQSAAQMVDRLERALDGRVAVQCPVTFSKRAIREAGRFVDRHPTATVGLLFGSVVGVVGGLIAGVLALAG